MKIQFEDESTAPGNSRVIWEAETDAVPREGDAVEIAGNCFRVSAVLWSWGHDVDEGGNLAVVIVRLR